MPRTSVMDFETANEIYAGAVVSFYTVSSGVKTSTLATLYDAPTGSGTLSNPQTLDSDGKFAAPVYVAEDVIATVSGLTVSDHDTGIIAAPLDGTDLAAAFAWTFDSSTAMEDPGTGDFRLNNATVSSVTSIAFNKATADAGNPDVSDFVATWDDSSNTIKGHLTLRKQGAPATFAVFTVSAVTDNTDWLEATVAHVDSNGAYSAADTVNFEFTRAGQSGSVAGPVSSTDNGVPRFDGAGGSQLQGSAVSIDDTGNMSGVVNLTMTGDIIDGNGSKSLDIGSIGSAVNQANINNAATGNAPSIKVTGVDSNIDLEIAGKGTGVPHFSGGFKRGSDASGDILYHNGTTYVRLAKGTDGQALTAGTPPAYAWSPVVQRVGNVYTTYASLTTVIPVDNTIPQNTEGTQIIASTSLTPKATSHILRVTAIIPVLQPSTVLSATAALFRDSTADAVAVTSHYFANLAPYHMTLIHEEAAGALTATSFKLRLGPTTGTLYVNGDNSAQLFGGVSAVRLIVEELQA